METNDPQKPQFSLKVSGNVEKFANIEPSQVRFAGPVGKELKVKVSITPVEKYPFKITGTRAKEGKNIRYKLEERKSPELKGYTLSVENVKADAGRYRDNIYLTTDSKARPEIDISVFGSIYAKPQNDQSNQNNQNKPGQEKSK